MHAEILYRLIPEYLYQIISIKILLNCRSTHWRMGANERELVNIWNVFIGISVSFFNCVEISTVAIHAPICVSIAHVTPAELFFSESLLQNREYIMDEIDSPLSMDDLFPLAFDENENGYMGISFKVYIDDSADRERKKYVIAGALIGDQSGWKAFGRKWRDALKGPPR